MEPALFSDQFRTSHKTRISAELGVGEQIMQLTGMPLGSLLTSEPNGIN